MELAKKLHDYSDLLLPDYSGKCIVNIPQHIEYLHGLSDYSPLASNTSIAGTTRTILFVLDGFGFKQWQEHEQFVPMLSQIKRAGNVQAVTSMFPSSTAPSITGLSTGLTTQQHGLIEWLMYESVSSQIIATLPFSAIGSGERDGLQGKIPAEVLLSSPTLYQRLTSQGIASYSLISSKYASSVYSGQAYNGSEVVPYSDLEELFGRLAELAANERPMHVNVYWDRIDTAGHTYGPNSPEYAAAVQQFFKGLQTFVNKNNPAFSGCRIMLAADHGQIAVEPENTIWLDELDMFDDNLAEDARARKIQPWGLQRDVYALVREDALDETIELLNKKLRGRGLAFKSRELLELGLFGRGDKHPDFENRIGNVLILPTGNHTIWYRHHEKEQFTYKGMHGGLTQDEVKIAFAEFTT